MAANKNHRTKRYERYREGKLKELNPDSHHPVSCSVPDYIGYTLPFVTSIIQKSFP
jgi:hypothetical protein